MLYSLLYYMCKEYRLFIHQLSSIYILVGILNILTGHSLNKMYSSKSHTLEDKLFVYYQIYIQLYIDNSFQINELYSLLC